MFVESMYRRVIRPGSARLFSGRVGRVDHRGGPLRHGVVLAGALVIIMFGQLAIANPLFEAWGEVQLALATSDQETLEVGLQRLLAAKKELGIQRVTPLAEALTEASIAHTGAFGDLLLETAKRLDPLLPAPRFMMGRRAWSNGHRVNSLGEYATGAVNMMRLPTVRRAVFSSGVLWVFVTLAMSVAAAIVVQVVMFFRLIAVDSYILGSNLFSRINALIFASVVVTLPIFAGLGPVWIVVYLFAMVWVYMPFSQRLAAVASLCFFVVFLPMLDIWENVTLVPTQLQERVIDVLTERKADFVTLREFVELEEEFGGSATYHVVAGELLRLHGDRELGRLEFERAMMVAPNAVLPRIFLGAFALEDKDPWRALELLSEGVAIDPNDALGHYNLAIALDLTRRFDEGDAERRRARELANGPLESLGIPGQEDRVLFPRLGSGIVEGLAAGSSTAAQFALDNRVQRRGVLRDLSFSALSLTALVGLLVGCGMLVVRLRWYRPARECDKCGKIFRPEDKSTYCEGCVSVFLRRNAVSIEQQTAKVAQVRRWELAHSLVTRVIGVVVPGGRNIVDGRVVLGVFVTFLVWLALMGAGFWVPLYLRTIEPALPVLGIQIVMAIAGVAGWSVSAVSAWNRR